MNVKRITISVPVDVAEYLDGHPNVSAAVTRVLRDRMEVGRYTRQLMSAAGFRFSEEGTARARAFLEGARVWQADRLASGEDDEWRR